MHTLLLPRVKKLALVLVLLVISSLPNLVHAATTTTLFSEDFSGATFPPSGWVDQSTAAFLYPPQSGWFQAPTGYNGSNGSAMCDLWDGATGFFETPTIDASVYNVDGDTAFVDFDFFWELNLNNDPSAPDHFYVYLVNSSGNSQVLSLETSVSYTYYNNSYQWMTDPDGSPSSWRHYTVGIPKAYRVSSLQIAFDGEAGYGAGNAAIDNVVVTATHYNRITYNPQFINFGSIATGLTSGARSVVISNPNPGPVTITNVALSGAQSGDYMITRTPTVIPGGTTAKPGVDSILITFSPSGSGTRNAAVSFNDNSDGPTFVSVSLTGTGISPTIAVSPATLFSKTRTKLGSYIDQFVIVTASVAASVIISPSTFLSGDYPGEYSILRLPSAPIPNGSIDTIWVRYHPTIEGSRPAILNIVSNASNGVQQVILKGVGILGRLVITPNNLNFDSVDIGTKSCKDITIYNAGSDTVVLTHNYFSSADGDFTLTPVVGSDSILPPDKSRIATVCFTPLRNGTRQARYRITTNIPMTFDTPRRDTSAFAVNIIGEGRPFGKLSIGGSPIVDSAVVGHQVCRTDTFYNTGTTDVTINSATIVGPGAADYTLSGVTFPLTVVGGGSQIFTICAKPSQRGDRTASLNIIATTNGQGLNATLPLDVFGQLACASATPNSAFARKTCVGMVDTAMITVSNCGDVSSSYTGSLPASATTYAIVGAATSVVVGANGSVTFPVTFKPTDRTPQNATLTITGNNGVSQTVTLTGSGQAATIAGSATADSTFVNSSKTVNVTINNTGECDWNPGTPTFSDPQFTYVSGSQNIPAGQAGTIIVKFTPTSVGLQTATLSFANAIGTSIPAASVTVSGVGRSTQGVSRLTEANGFSLSQNYPNPFNPTTEIRFVLAKDGNAQMNIIDVTGKVVRTVFNERMSAGQHTTVVDASELASGVYYYQLVAGNTVLTRQMVLSK